MERERTYSWVPARKSQGAGRDDSSTQSSVRFHSGLKQQLAERQAEEELEVKVPLDVSQSVNITHKWLSRCPAQEVGRKGKSDHKLSRGQSAATGGLRKGLARCGDLIFILILAGLIVLVFFLGIFFTFYHTT